MNVSSLQKQAIGKFQSSAPALSERIRLLNPRSRERRRHLKSKSRAGVFQDIFDANGWQDAESRSGSGSTLEATELIRSVLPTLLRRHEVSSLVDVPCGDFNWMQAVDLAGITYTGIDIVPNLIDQLNEQYGCSSRSFVAADVVESDLPAADAVFCRDLLLHLCLQDASAAVARMTSSFRVRILSTNPEVRNNTDIVNGETRHLNLELAPFSLGPPTQTLQDPTERFPNRVMGVWTS